MGDARRLPIGERLRRGIRIQLCVRAAATVVLGGGCRFVMRVQPLSVATPGGDDPARSESRLRRLTGVGLRGPKTRRCGG